MVFSVLTQVSDTTDVSELENLSNRGSITKDETTSGECWSNPEASAKDHDSEEADMIGTFQ